MTDLIGAISVIAIIAFVAFTPIVATELDRYRRRGYRPRRVLRSTTRKHSTPVGPGVLLANSGDFTPEGIRKALEEE